MWLITVIAFISLYNFTHLININLKMCKNENDKNKNIAGYDNRFEKKNDTDIGLLRLYRNKYDLLKILERDDIVEQEKLRLIYASHFLDDMNPYVIKGPNFTKGLKW
jgi:hypothetical protein